MSRRTEMAPPAPAIVTSADGTQIGYRAGGSGPSLLLVHGAAVDGTCWAASAAFLGDHFLTVTVDRRGRGASGDAGDYTAQREIEDLQAVVTMLPPPVHVMGHSSGALLALELARVTPAVDRVVAYEPPVLMENDDRAASLAPRLRELVASGDREAAARLFFAEGPRLTGAEVEALARSPVWAPALAAAHTLAYDVELVLAYGVRALSDPVTTATLVLCGAASAGWVRSGMESLARALPAGGLAILAGQKHAALWAAPALLAGTATEFLLARTG